MINLAPTGFSSFSEYWKFLGAREFRTVDDSEKVMYAKTRLERLGDAMVYPIARLTDYSMTNIRNPLMIFSVTLILMVAVTILFYPEELIKAVIKVIPIAYKIKPWMIKSTLFIVLQVTLLGTGIRTFGRLDSSGELWRLWNDKSRQIIPIALGTQIIPKKI